MKTFDIHKRKTLLEGDFGLRRSFDLDFAQATQINSLWWDSKTFVRHGIDAILCSQFSDSSKILEKSKLWMERAIATGERTRNFEETSNKFHRQLYAMICWLHDNAHDQADLDIWLIETQKWFRNHPEQLTPAELGLEAVTFINAGAYEEYISLAAPGGLESITLSGASEKRMALTLAAAALTQKFPEDKLQKTVTKFLDNNVGTWLNNGHSVRAAEWMKVIYWKRGTTGISPADAVRKCLDHVELA